MLCKVHVPKWCLIFWPLAVTPYLLSEPGTHNVIIFCQAELTQLIFLVRSLKKWNFKFWLKISLSFFYGLCFEVSLVDSKIMKFSPMLHYRSHSFSCYVYMYDPSQVNFVQCEVEVKIVQLPFLEKIFLFPTKFSLISLSKI